MSLRAVIGGCAFLGLAACTGSQNVLGGQGAEAANFVSLFTIFTVVCAVFYVLVSASLLIALRKRRDALTIADGRHHQSARPIRPALIAWTALVVAGLTMLTAFSFLTDRSNAAASRRPQLLVTVTANQWWWDVEYHSPDASRTLHTANEIHLPVGIPAEVLLRSNDVIHSLWIPNLAGKQDLIPGRQTDLQLVPRTTGHFRGQCAEFCGVQHALMALDVTVESKADFQRWYQAQLATAKLPASPLQLAGYRYVTQGQCSSCHAIAGTPANGQIAPDLTHLASRRTLAAGTIPMSSANLQRWIVDPQGQKPGSHMPNLGLSPREGKAVTAYLETLK